MNITELQTVLITLTKRNISQTNIAEAFGTTRSNISLRMKNKSEVTPEELKKVEAFFNVSISGDEKVNIVNNLLNDIQQMFNLDEKGMLVIKTLLNNKKCISVTKIFIEALQGNADSAEAVIGILKVPEIARTFIE